MSHSEPFAIKPTFVSVDQELLRRLHAVCNMAIENANEILVKHDSLHGRTTRKNQVLAELYEQDIRQAKQSLAEVRSALGWPAQANTPAFERGDLVEAIPPYALVCGSGLYKRAVLVSVEPFVAVSETGDMLWRSTITPENVKKTGKASPECLAIAIKRYAPD